jgi:ubiquinone/menaquinone biosynthesis C-methylase UbiE
MTESDATPGGPTGGHLMGFEGANAVAWHKWFHIMEDAAQPLSELMVERAGLAPGHRVLDVATGLGEPAITAARRIAPTGFVDATDISDDLLEFGRDRAATLGITNIAFRHMDAGEAGRSPATYDTVLCRWGLMFVDELDAVLAGLRACLVPDGYLVATVLGAARRCAGSQPRHARARVPRYAAARLRG